MRLLVVLHLIKSDRQRRRLIGGLAEIARRVANLLIGGLIGAAYLGPGRLHGLQIELDRAGRRRRSRLAGRGGRRGFGRALRKRRTARHRQPTSQQNGAGAPKKRRHNRPFSPTCKR